MRYLGVQVGQVTDVEIDPDHEHVVVEAELRRSDADLAREGSRFWIVRPEVQGGSVEGLGTIISGSYIAVLPGLGPPAEHFEGLRTAPVLKHLAGDLRIALRAPRLSSVTPNTSVYCRGVQIGAVRDNTVFWSVGGIQVHGGLFSGLDIRARSLAAIAAGGIAMATPDAPGKKVDDGHVFGLADKQDDKWLQWSPKIPLGELPSAVSPVY